MNNPLQLQIGIHSFKKTNGINIKISSMGISFEELGSNRERSINSIIQSLLYETIRDNVSRVKDRTEELKVIDLIELLEVFGSGILTADKEEINNQAGEVYDQIENILENSTIAKSLADSIRLYSSQLRDRISNSHTINENRPREMYGLVLNMINFIDTQGRELYTVFRKGIGGKQVGISVLDKEVTIEQLLEVGKLKAGNNELMLVYEGTRKDILSLLEEGISTLPKEGAN